MIFLSNEVNHFVKDNFPYMKIREDKVIVNGEFLATIPSKLFPLLNKRSIKFFCMANTAEIEDEKVKEVFNSIEFQLGRCYTNTNNLVQKFKENNITDIKTYAGWITVGRVPIHHCWAVYKDIYLLDGGVEKTDVFLQRYFKEKKITDIDEQRKIIVKTIFENKTKKNSEIKTFGQTIPFYTYIGTETSPTEGVRIYSEMVAKYPDHPSYKTEGQNPNGASKVQKMVFEAEENNGW